MLSQVWVKCAAFVVDYSSFTIAMINLVRLLFRGISIDIELYLRRSLRDYLL